MRRLMGYVQIFILIQTIFFCLNTNYAISSEKNQLITVKNVVLSKTKYHSKYDSDSKKVYLTFDDGPSYKVTNNLLDTLKENEVKATFFVVGKEIIGREYILKRIYEEGHSIALHTYSHNFKTIYKSNESFIEEMKKTATLINDIIGIQPNAIRFPGGSSGILNEEFLNTIHENGFKVYDWNVDLCDGVNPGLSIESLLKNAKRAKGDQNNRIILAHCNYNNINTCKALSGIIKYYKENGFTFETINDTTEEYYYKFKGKNHTIKNKTYRGCFKMSYRKNLYIAII